MAILGSVLVRRSLATEVSSVVMKVGELDLSNVFSFSGERYTKWKSEEKNHGSNSLPSTLSSTLTRISSFYPNIKALVTTVAENLGGRGGWSPSTSNSNEYSFHEIILTT